MKHKVVKLAISSCLVLIFGIVYFAVEGKQRKMQNIPAGTWGGQHIRIVIENGSASIEYDCAHGTINGPLRLDRNGKFHLTGTHVREMGGPVRLNMPRKGEPAGFTGWTDGKKMTLTVTLSDSKEDIGTFSLVRGSEGRIRKCR